MSAYIINGTELAKEKRAQLAKEVQQLKNEGIEPGLAVVLVGDNPASRSYVKAKQRACEEIGIRSVLLEFPDTIKSR
jgi:methylenetetrahydrofolate dehydrogenase (NADP+)/methenyltetrahydrofolate cyclohydrolase